MNDWHGWHDALMNLFVWLPGFTLMAIITGLHIRMLRRECAYRMRVINALIELAQSEADMNVAYTAYAFRLSHTALKIAPDLTLEPFPDDKIRKAARIKAMRIVSDLGAQWDKRPKVPA